MALFQDSVFQTTRDPITGIALFQGTQPPEILDLIGRYENYVRDSRSSISTAARRYRGRR